MRRLTINGKEYTVEFSIEASLYNECTESVMNLIMGFGEAQGELENAKKDKDAVRESIQKTLFSFANVAPTAMTLFYAGLLEHHGVTMEEAKELIALYLKENDASFLDVLNLMIEVMGEDHFFDLTGLSRILNQVDLEDKKKRKKTGAN